MQQWGKHHRFWFWRSSGLHLIKRAAHFHASRADILHVKLKQTWQKGLRERGNRNVEMLLQEVFLAPSCRSCTWAFPHNCSVFNKSGAAFLTSSTQRTFHPAVLWGPGVFNKHVNYHSALARMQRLVFSYWRTLQFEVYRAIKDPRGAPDM